MAITKIEDFNWMKKGKEHSTTAVAVVPFSDKAALTALYTLKLLNEEKVSIVRFAGDKGGILVHYEGGQSFYVIKPDDFIAVDKANSVEILTVEQIQSTYVPFDTPYWNERHLKPRTVPLTEEEKALVLTTGSPKTPEVKTKQSPPGPSVQSGP